MISLGYNDSEHFFISKIEVFGKIKNVWNEGKEAALKLMRQEQNLQEGFFILPILKLPKKRLSI
jgi:hypothetical protein